MYRILLENFSKLEIWVGTVQDEIATVTSWNVLEALLTFPTISVDGQGKEHGKKEDGMSRLIKKMKPGYQGQCFLGLQ